MAIVTSTTALHPSQTATLGSPTFGGQPQQFGDYPFKSKAANGRPAQLGSALSEANRLPNERLA